MNGLVKVDYTNDRPTVLGRELHKMLDVKTEYKDWFPRMCEYGFSEGKDGIGGMGLKRFYVFFPKTDGTGWKVNSFYTEPEAQHFASLFAGAYIKEMY